MTNMTSNSGTNKNVVQICSTVPTRQWCEEIVKEKGPEGSAELLGYRIIRVAALLPYFQRVLINTSGEQLFQFPIIVQLIPQNTIQGHLETF